MVNFFWRWMQPATAIDGLFGMPHPGGGQPAMIMIVFLNTEKKEGLSPHDSQPSATSLFYIFSF